MKCEICGKHFTPDKKDVYQVVEQMTTLGMLSEVPKTFDAVDCPRCGCQKVLTVRMNRVHLAEGVNEDDN